MGQVTWQTIYSAQKSRGRPRYNHSKAFYGPHRVKISRGACEN